MFGEYVPLRSELPFLAAFAPFPAEFGLAPGEDASVFHQNEWRYTPIICFEDTVPHLVRRIVQATALEDANHRPADCLINLTNDGWFHGSSELDQHLITALFRCVECRMPMVRAVNTGISAVIDGDGVVVDPDVFLIAEPDENGRVIPRKVEGMRNPETGRWYKQVNAVLVDSIPLDDRESPYVAGGDWFAGSCGFLTLAVLLGGLVPRKRRAKAG